MRRVKFYDKKLSHKKILRVEEIADYRSLAKKMCNWGAACDAKGAQRLSKYLFQMIYLEENRGKIEDISFFQKTGWLQDDFAEFAFPTGIEGKYPVFRGNFDYEAAFKERGEYEKSLALMRTLLTASVTSRLALGAGASFGSKKRTTASLPAFGNRKIRPRQGGYVRLRRPRAPASNFLLFVKIFRGTPRKIQRLAPLGRRVRVNG